jgi:hypothetical protein
MTRQTILIFFHCEISMYVVLYNSRYKGINLNWFNLVASKKFFFDLIHWSAD